MGAFRRYVEIHGRKTYGSEMYGSKTTMLFLTRSVKLYGDFKNGLKFALATMVQMVWPFEVTKYGIRTENLTKTFGQPNRT